jgi:N-acetylglucosaminyl-diphospho-decaprenol L-rhamnosyltransferase
MVLSVIIVNYRVRFFLELCLHSVEKALLGLDAEILVVDNHSADGSMEMLRPIFPRVKFIVNSENTGFARANNQALELSKGEYILFLNPDTVVPEDVARRCLSFLQSAPPQSAPPQSARPQSPPQSPPHFSQQPPPSSRIGGIGVRMIDGGGRFLKESRRGLPTPWVAFCKLSGLTAFFPRSRWFSTYYLGHLPADRTHPSPVLSGACLCISRAALLEAGSFDEDFFMYAEDIDLSYRLEKAGFVNYYFADSTIIHFKGESTKKDIRYVRQFYKAMSQFRRKHFSQGMPGLFRAALEAAIWLRAGLKAGLEMSKMLFRRQSGPASPRSVWLTGDPAGVDQLRQRVFVAGERMAAPDQERAEEIIFCVGDEFSFKEAIMALESTAAYRKGQQVKIYAAGARAIVGSTHRDGPGEIRIL